VTARRCSSRRRAARYFPHHEAMKQAESGVVGIAMQQFVSQSAFFVHFGLHARRFVES
jgi:hypothetical protein